MELDDKWLRPAVCYLVKVRKEKQKDVAELFGINPNKVSRIIKRFTETGSNKNRGGQGRKKTARSEVKIQEARNHLERNNHTKFRNGEMARPAIRSANLLKS